MEKGLCKCHTADPIGCLKCYSDVKECTECKPGFVLNTGVCTCDPVDNNCNTCVTNANECTKCNNNYVLANGKCVCVPD